jgi:hypothetical protein
MKTYNEWLDDRGATNPDVSLADEQVTMMVDRLIGLLHGLPQREKTALVEKAIKTLGRVIRD